MAEVIQKNDIINEFNDSFLRYSMSVITDRALPDSKDGLKPVHRRIAYDMVNLLNLKSSGKFVKSARIVGDVIGKLHPHGDTSVYDAACRLTLDYVMRYPLIKGQGSFGSTDGDGAAAMRYTEMKPTELLELMVGDIKKNVVDMVPNFANDEVEPTVLPALFPNILCNPNSGIAVAMSCNFAPHNLTEVCNGIIAYIKNNNITIDELMNYIPGPDFPLGGTIINKRDIKEAYETGKSGNTLRIRGDYEVKDNIIHFTSIPFGVTRAKIREQINNNIEQLDKYIVDFNDNTNKNGIKIDFEINNLDNLNEALRIIFKVTSLETTFPINNVCLVDGQAKRLSLKELIIEYVKHQIEIIIKTALYDKDKAEKRAHILKGIIIALAQIDDVINLIRESNNKNEAREALISFLKIDDIQANAILDMKLSKLTKLDENDLKKELEEKLKIIEECNKIINNEDYRNELLISKIKNMRDKYGDARRTKLDDIIIEKNKTLKEEIPDTPVKINIKTGSLDISFVKKDKNGMNLNTKMNSTIVFFTNLGMAYKLPVTKIKDKIQNLKELIKLKPGEKILNIMDINNTGIVYQTTKYGMIKKTNASDFNSSRAVQSIKLKDNDEVIDVSIGENFKYICQSTKDLYEIMFNIEDISITGRTGVGVRGIKLHENDYVKAACFSNKIKQEVSGKRGQVGKKVK